MTNKEELQSQFKTYECRIRRGVTQFVSEYMNKSRGFVSENNCELIDWIMSNIENSFCDLATNKREADIWKKFSGIKS